MKNVIYHKHSSAAKKAFSVPRWKRIVPMQTFPSLGGRRGDISRTEQIRL